LCDSAVAVGHELIEAARNEPQWHSVAKQMLHAWDDGMASLRSPKKSLQFKGLKPAIEAAGFSAPEPPEKTREVIGRSPLLGKR
jgi:serine/threonine-protein kinase HipA